jgi:hypothetical protein
MWLRLQSAQYQAWQNNVQAATRNAIAYQQRQTLMNELEAAINPPPPPEPEIIYVEAEQGTGRLGYADFDPRLMARPLRWFG